MTPFRGSTMRTTVLCLCGVALCAAGLACAGSEKVGPDKKTWDSVAQKAAKFLQSTQDKKGGWSTDKSPGITGIALTGLLKTGQTTAQDPVGQNALKYIESLVNPDKKHIAGKDPKVQLQNYVTSINVMALVEAKQDAKYKAIIGDAIAFLKKLQWDEDDGKNQESDFFGGAGY